jgi:predicted DNA-binding transcriptional regulator YafY
MAKLAKPINQQIMDQPKIERLLRMMQLLTDRSRVCTVDTLAAAIGVSQRTAYRYLDTFESGGLLIEREGSRVSLSRDSKYFRMISELAYFNKEEAYIIKKALEVLSPDSQAVRSIKIKLANIYDFSDVATLLTRPGREDVVSSLLFAIAEERQVVLKDYHSINTRNISDRLVEPLSFSLNMVSVYCYEVKSGMCKYFRIERIGGVDVTEVSWKYRGAHKTPSVDVFRFSGDNPMRVKLRLTMVAATLLLEEFPLSEQHLTQIGEDMFILDCDLYDYQGAARFVLGLCNEIEVLDSPEFINYLNEKRDGSKF